MPIVYACPVCESAAVLFETKPYDRASNFGSFTIFHVCDDCKNKARSSIKGNVSSVTGGHEAMGEGRDVQINVVSEDKKNTPLHSLMFSTRVYRSLQRTGFKTLGDITCVTESAVLCIPHLGLKSLKEIKMVLSTFGLSLSNHGKETKKITWDLKPLENGGHWSTNHRLISIC